MSHRPVGAAMEGDHITAVTLENLQTGDQLTIEAHYVLERRIRYSGHHLDDVSDVTLVNWPQVDYWRTPLVGVTAGQRVACLEAARELTLCFVHWLQTDAPRPDGATGYPGLRLCPEVLGTHDGLAAAAYVRQSRRIVAEFTVLESHVGVDARRGAERAEDFPDTVGVGCYRIDLHGTLARRPVPLPQTASMIGPARAPSGTPLLGSSTSRSFWSRLVSSCTGLLTSKPGPLGPFSTV